MLSPLLQEIAATLEVDQLDDRERAEVEQLVDGARRNPSQLALHLLKMRGQYEAARRRAERAVEAIAELEGAMRKLAHGSHTLTHLVAVRDGEDRTTAVCRANGYMRELPIHPDVDVDQLRQLESWEYVCVHDDIVVGFWKDDPRLIGEAMGNVVTFRGYADRDLRLIRVMDGPQERVVQLDRSLWQEPLLPQSLLILQRDNPQRAIRIIQREVVQSRFEVPIDRLHTRLDDLAGVESLAGKLIEDILLRVCFDDIRSQFGLAPLKGILLYSRPGMGKTALARALALWFYEHRDELGFDIVLYNIKPNATKSMWHGEDARIVREDLWGAVRARQNQPRTRPLIQILVLDEIDSMGQRPGPNQHIRSSAQSDALEAMLAEMDGIESNDAQDGPPAYVLTIGLTNRLDRVDEALQRPGRFDLVLPMPEVTIDSAEDVMAVYACRRTVPWQLDGEVRAEADEEQIRSRFLRPALARCFSMVVVRYKTEARQSIDVTAGEILANVHYKEAVNRAKRRAAVRTLRRRGVPAVTVDDVLDCLLEVATDAARQLAEDPHTLVRQLGITVPVTAVDAVPREELDEHRYLRVQSA